MAYDIQMFLVTFLLTLYFILPAYFSNASGLVFGGGLPVDFGKSDKNGVRWIGDGVTWRGFIAGTIVGTLLGAVQGYFGPEIIKAFGQSIVPIATSVPEGIMIGFLLGFGALLGDAIGSFLKEDLELEEENPHQFSIS